MADAEEGVGHGPVDAVAGQLAVPLLGDGPAAQELDEEVGGEVAERVEEREVAGDAELAAHEPEGLQVEQDQGRLETSKADGVELRRDADPEVVLGIQLRRELPDMQAHAVVCGAAHQDAVRDADDHGCGDDVCVGLVSWD